ncbi:hypothetical protein D9M69_710390 [compost metagenome]
MRPTGICIKAPAAMVTLTIKAISVVEMPDFAPNTAPSVPHAPLAMPIRIQPTKAAGELR